MKKNGGNTMQMHLRLFVIAVVSVTLFTTACAAEGPASSASESATRQFEGVLLHGHTILITQSFEQQLEDQLIMLNFPDGMSIPPQGSLYRYEIDAVAESWPLQGRVQKIEELRHLAGPIVISFDTADTILRHKPFNTHLIDVRTGEEYESGHVSGAQNIPVDQIETAILNAVPDKSDVIIVYCRSGIRSANAGRILEKLGYRVLLDAGGIIQYQGEIVQGREAGPLPGQS